jgi:hypothetical protein
MTFRSSELFLTTTDNGLDLQGSIPGKGKRFFSTPRETRNAYRILVGKPEGKRPLGRPRRRWTVLKWILQR